MGESGMAERAVEWVMMARANPAGPQRSQRSQPNTCTKTMEEAGHWMTGSERIEAGRRDLG